MPHAFVLHSRPYKETSALVDFITPDGRLRAVLRGARAKAGSLARAFIPLDVELRGKTELKSVVRLEATGRPLWLVGEALFSGLYLNELLLRLLAVDDPHPELFAAYASTLAALDAGRPLEPLLRAFEWCLLTDLGYGFALDTDLDGEPIEPGRLYRLQPDRGLEPIEAFQPGAFQGAVLLGMAIADWAQPGTLMSAKRLMRQALAPHLGSRPLASRELFINLKGKPRE
ncbi:DNA repair protein RecO [Stutzerimonas tarimensis]|uniref:DNA repair protein RecO n=1 Tax=Stutzerimonas tarimensis TaxID=1507735 RepID=A0ABV7T8F1_9GAMM